MNVVAVLLSRRDAAQRLSISLRLLDYAIQSGALKVRRIGRRVLVPTVELERFARRDHGRIAPAPEGIDGR